MIEIEDTLQNEVPNVTFKDVSFSWPGKNEHVINNCNFSINKTGLWMIVGKNGSGKSTLLKLINGLLKPSNGVITKLANIGMVFQKPNPFPKSIFENVAYGPRIHGTALDKTDLEEVVVNSLKRAAIFDEVKDRMHESGTSLSGGQQQRLCIARAISVNPEIILMDEPCSALDPIATAKIEDLMGELSKDFTIVIVTHSMQQAARVSKKTGFFHMGYLIEVGPTEVIFSNPENQKTQDYITGRFG